MTRSEVLIARTDKLLSDADEAMFRMRRAAENDAIAAEMDRTYP
jgi:hypothetical protein